MSRSLKWVIAVFGALAVPVIFGATASAAAINGQAKGKQAIAQFAVFDTLHCGDGRTESMQTFFSILPFETSIRMQGQFTTTLETDVFVSRAFMTRKFTSVGLLRASIGPPMSVSVRGVFSLACASNETAPSTGTVG